MSATYAWGLHSTLLNVRDVREHLLGAIISGRMDERRFRTLTGYPEIELDLEDVYQAGKPFSVSARVPGMIEEYVNLTATPLDGGESLHVRLQPVDQRYEAEITLRSGVWRIRVEGRVSKAIEDLLLAVAGDGQPV